MASDSVKKWQVAPFVWTFATIAFACITGYCLAHGSQLWVVMIICSVSCGLMISRSLMRISKRIRYVMEATLNGDFSYKFPTADINEDDRSTNEMLNQIVEHLERLTYEARQNEAFLFRVINLTDIGLILADAKGDIRLHNEAALRLLERRALTHICQLPENADSDLVINRSDVTVNEKSFILLTVSDLSRQMQAVEVKSWEKLTRVLTHEIMNSLTPIQSIAENMSGKASTKEMIEALDTISSSSSALMQFVKSFREFSILPEPNMRAIYIKPLLESSIRMAESYMKDNEINFNLSCFPPDLMVYTDEVLLSRVLINILKNAIEANPEAVTIEADVKADESVEIRISNDGELISDETAEHIFIPFFTTRSSGSGIGLSLSRRIVTHLGGTLSFKTRPFTSFSIRL